MSMSWAVNKYKRTHLELAEAAKVERVGELLAALARGRRDRQVGGVRVECNLRVGEHAAHVI